ncbi:MAG: phosphatidate cytidylyltransferase [Candidatus Wallbacteria bacterium]|nr:phosphatidate cytidylyltransferase [Candidatus Wallbacteria bacterium]
MAFETLAVRTTSALLLAPAFLLPVWLGGPPLAGLLALVALGCMHEFCAIARAAGHAPSQWLAYAGAAGVCAGAYSGGFPGAAAAMTLFPLALIFPYLAAADHSKAIVDSSLTLLGVTQYAYFLSFLYLIRADARMGLPVLVILLVLVWVEDSAAYLVGSAIGKHKLTPISPKKTWEGTGAGFVLSLAAAAATARYGFGHPVGILTLALLAVVGGLAQLGDLSESLLKRNFGVKDSGSTIPGHGGLLDRFDSLCLSAPAMFVLFPGM